MRLTIVSNQLVQQTDGLLFAGQLLYAFERECGWLKVWSSSI